MGYPFFTSAVGIAARRRPAGDSKMFFTDVLVPLATQRGVAMSRRPSCQIIRSLPQASPTCSPAPLVAFEHGLTALADPETSRKTISRHWTPVFGLPLV